MDAELAARAVRDEPVTGDPVARDWDRFRRLATLKNHWERPGWVDGRRAYYWYITFEHSAELRQLATTC